MGKKKSKARQIPSGNASRKTRTKSAGNQTNDILIAILFGLAGGALHFFITPLLPFYPDNASTLTILGSFLSAALAFIFARTSFNKSKVISIAFGVFLLHIATNLAMTYEWVGNSPVIGMIASSLTVPLAITWYFIFRARAVTREESDFVFSLRNSFRDPIVRIAGVLVLMISAVLIFYKLGYFNIWEDENLVINAAIGIQERGMDYLKDGYDRVWLHSWLISVVFDLVGVSEFNGRLLSAIAGAVFVLVCFYVFTRWYGIGMLAVLIPVACLMNDRFLILFRYMRMYALLIPVFLGAVYFFYRTVTLSNEGLYFMNKRIGGLQKKWLYVVLSLPLLLLLAHLHKLSMIVLPVFSLFIAVLVWRYRTKELKYVLFAILGGGVVLLVLTFAVQLDSLEMFRQVYRRLIAPHQSFPVYYSYMFGNVLPMNNTVMLLIAGVGLLTSGIAKAPKNIMTLSYIFIVVALASMIYLVAGEGRDYRYIAHIVPFLVGIVMYVLYQAGAMVSKKYVNAWLFLIVAIASLQLITDYKRVYVRHPWAPFYTNVYETLKKDYKPGEALFYQNIKTFYLDPEALAGEHVYKLPKNKEYTLEKFKADLTEAKKGWVMYEQHKSYHWQQEILNYMYTNFKMIHGTRNDDYGIDLFYFDESMIK